MPGTVLIIAPPDDAHAVAVEAALKSHFDSDAIIWDNSGIPSDKTFDLYLDNERSSLSVEDENATFSIQDLSSIWWRRISRFRIDYSVSDPKVRNFCVSECDALFKGAINSIDVPIINDPFREARATYKPFQLAAAKKFRLDVPKTLMSNNAGLIRDFVSSLGDKCVYKPFTAPFWTITETRSFTSEDTAELDEVRHAPIIVQEKIQRGRDIRVNIFGNCVFAAEIETRIKEAEVDWRLDRTAQWIEHKLPDALVDKLVIFVTALGLNYGCVDMRKAPDGSYKFFEINPSGQFLFVEIDTGQPLVRNLAALLAQRRSSD
jgi:glutathione synthase/RimK-type ligase-like ATP-grasp enzyme